MYFLRRLYVVLLAPLLFSTALARAADDAAVPFTSEHNQIVIQVKVAKAGPFSMLLDTGTTPSAIDTALAHQLGLELRGKGNATLLPGVQVGSLQIDSLDGGAIDLTSVARAVGVPIQGVLGHSFFANRIVQIDYPHHLVRFLASAPPASPNGFALPFAVESDEPIIHVTVNGTPLSAVLDTGFGGVAVLNPQAIDRLGLGEQVAGMQATSGVGFGGSSALRKGKIASLEVGGYVVNNPDVTFRLKGGRFDHMPADLNIGNGLLQAFVVTFDYQQDIITFQR
ncbi:MAG TPA: pepsin/retropepsin-like aspartic protease family protein [Candidatus Rubrimentiphilum sp.]|nr:pepsin/retropepsin-like aspartic protease family protein [Candidatus Rubrimentiphilum sp.]